jgi:hypothetical protein
MAVVDTCEMMVYKFDISSPLLSAAHNDFKRVVIMIWNLLINYSLTVIHRIYIPLLYLLIHT